MENGANPDVSDKRGIPALILAIESNITELVEILLDNEANLNISNDEGNNALLLAIEYGKVKIAKLVLKERLRIKYKSF